MRRKIIAYVLLVLIPLSLVLLQDPLVGPAWAYVYTKMGASAEEVAIWGVATAIMCGWGWTGVAAIGCGIAAAG